MPEHEIKIRRYAKSDETPSVRLLLSKLPTAEVDAEFPARRKRWRWQYYENPGNPGDEPVLWVASTEASLVGLICPLAVRLKTPKGIMTASWCNDWIVSRQARGSGLGRALEEKWQHTYPVALGREYSDRAYEVSVSLGFATVGGFRTGLFVLSRSALAKRLYRLKHYRELGRLFRLPPKINLGRRKRPGSAHRVATTLPNGVVVLWEQVAEAYPFAIDRNREYLKWRYESHPTHRYEFITLNEGGKLSGVAVVRIGEGRAPIGVVEEVIVHPGKPDFGTALVGAAVEHLKGRGACAVRIDIPPKLDGPVLRVPYPWLGQDLAILVSSDDPDLPGMGINEAANWYLSRGDSDADF